VQEHKLPYKQALIKLEKEKSDHKKKEDLIDHIIMKNQRVSKIRNLKKKYIAKVSRENHQILERVASASSGKKNCNHIHTNDFRAKYYISLFE